MKGVPAVRRLIVCVDGTWYGPDGTVGNNTGNNSNVFRIYAAIKQGTFLDHDGRLIQQSAKYEYGIGAGKGPIGKVTDGITGKGCEEQIEDVFYYCCKHAQSPNSELWLYGFSRGAYIVRAVAGLLHHMGVPSFKNRTGFTKAYQKALKLYPSIRRSDTTGNSGEKYLYFEKAEPSPVIQFIGAFDTVKATDDRSLHDLSFLPTTKHARHALAMNEDRISFTPTLFDSAADSPCSPGRSLIQAWFIGAHSDIGGGPAADGLSLYPLQWVLIESKAFGLVLDHNPTGHAKGLIENPLALASLPVLQNQVSTGTPDGTDRQPSGPWKFVFTNGITIEMHDLRPIHNHGNLQSYRNKLRKGSKPVKDTHGSMWPWFKREKDGFRNPAIDPLVSSAEFLETNGESPADASPQHIVKVNQGLLSLKVPRQLFKKGNAGCLVGYSEEATNSTIIHPSSYFLADVYPRFGIDQALKRFTADLEAFRASRLPMKTLDPWTVERLFRRGDFKEPKAFRILVCGRAGIGKSTLINRVFGKDMTKESQRDHGIHDIEEGFELDTRPGLIVHDSRGFKSGGTNEVAELKKFVKKRPSMTDPSDSIHAIWLCIRTDENRMVDDSEEASLRVFSKYAPKVPVVIVKTMKDKYLAVSREEVREDHTRKRITITDQEVLEKAEQKLLERSKDDSTELERKGFSTDDTPLAYVSRDDSKSIKDLLQLTLNLTIDEDARISCVAAQVIDVEQKIKLAVTECVRLLRHAEWTSMATSPLVFASTVSTPTISRLLCNNIMRCFGFIDIMAEDVDGIMSKVVWWNLTKFMAQSVSQSILIWGGTATLTLFTLVGGIPLAIGAPLLEVLPAARMIIKCACDLIIILDRAFSNGGKTATKEEINHASKEYTSKISIDAGLAGCSRKSKVHQEVEELIPIMSWKFYKPMQISKLQNGVEEIIERNRFGLGDNKLDLTATPRRSIYSTHSEEPEELKEWQRIVADLLDGIE